MADISLCCSKISGYFIENCKNGKLKEVELFFQKWLDVNNPKILFENEDVRNGFTMAAQYGHLDIISFMINQQKQHEKKLNQTSNVNTLLKYSLWFPIYRAASAACYQGHLNIVKVLVNEQDEWFVVRNLLVKLMETAGVGGNLDIFDYLFSLKHKAYRTIIIDEAKNNVDMYIIQSGNLDIIKQYTTQHYFNPYFRINWNAAFHRATVGGHMEVLLLLDKIRKQRKKKEPLHNDVEWEDLLYDVGLFANKWEGMRKISGKIITKSSINELTKYILQNCINDLKKNNIIQERYWNSIWSTLGHASRLNTFIIVAHTTTFKPLRQNPQFTHKLFMNMLSHLRRDVAYFLDRHIHIRIKKSIHIVQYGICFSHVMEAFDFGVKLSTISNAIYAANNCHNGTHRAIQSLLKTKRLQMTKCLVAFIPRIIIRVAIFPFIASSDKTYVRCV